MRRDLLRRRRDPANQRRIPHRHNDRTGLGKLLQDFAANRCGTGRQIRVGRVVQKMHPRLLGILRRQRERRRQIAPSAFHNRCPQR